MRREQQIRAIGVRVVGAERLDRENIERGAAEVPALQGRDDRAFVDDAAARAVDEHGAALHCRDPRGIEQILRRSGERDVQADHVGRRHQRVERDGAHAGTPERGVGGIELRVVCDHRHADRTGQRRGPPADRAETDEPERLGLHLAAVAERVARPAARGDVGGGRIGASQQQQRRRDHVFGDRLRIRTGGRDHLDSASCASLDVDVVEADAEPPDDFAARHRREQLAAHLCAVADDQRIGVGNDPAQLRRIIDQRRVVEDLVFAAQARDRVFVHELADDDAGHVSAALARGCAAATAARDSSLHALS